jgi:hypothetical protein
MFMNTILPRFKEFCTNEVLARDYDYIVPLESKGILLLNQVLGDGSEWEKRVRYLRSFDFESSESLANKRIALIDDTVVFGNSLDRAQQTLRDRGVKHVDKYACMHRIHPESKRDLSGVTIAARVSLTEYDLMLEELSALTLRQRPSFPDHLSYTARFADYHPTQSVVLGLRTLGILCEYRRTTTHTEYSLHYPSFAPTLPTNARDTGPNKIRFRITRDEQHMVFSPGLFPSITSPEQLLGTDDLLQRIHTALERPWHNGCTKRLNLYEAFTLAMRMRMAANFIAALHDLGMPVTQLDLANKQMARYFGERTAEDITRIAREQDRPSPDKPSQRREDTATSATTLVEPVDTITLTTAILRTVKEEYNKHNAGVIDRSSWESAGLNIEDLAHRTGRAKSTVSYGVELLNDYGHVVPLQAIAAHRSERVYRSTEIGERKLVETYGAPDR